MRDKIEEKLNALYLEQEQLFSWYLENSHFVKEYLTNYDKDIRVKEEIAVLESYLDLFAKKSSV